MKLYIKFYYIEFKDNFFFYFPGISRFKRSYVETIFDQILTFWHFKRPVKPVKKLIKKIKLFYHTILIFQKKRFFFLNIFKHCIDHKNL